MGSSDLLRRDPLRHHAIVEAIIIELRLTRVTLCHLHLFCCEGLATMTTERVAAEWNHSRRIDRHPLYLLRQHATLED